MFSTNKFLKTIKVREDDKCTFCHHEQESLTHMLWFCSEVQVFIVQIESMLIAKYNRAIKITPATFFFLRDTSNIETIILTLMKLVIYEARLNEVTPTKEHFFNKLKFEAEKERAAAKTQNKKEAFIRKWGSLRSIIQ